MTLNNRERMIALIVGGVVALYMGYTFAYQPYVGTVADYDKQIKTLSKRANENAATIRAQTQAKSDFEKLIKSLGAIGDPFAQIQQTSLQFYQLALNNNVFINRMTPQRSTVPKGGPEFTENRYAVTADTTSRSLWQFLFLLENSKLPIRAEEVQIKSHKDGVDDLSVELVVSILTYSPPTPTRPAGRGAATGRGAIARTVDPTSSPTLDVEKLMMQRREQESRDAGTRPLPTPASLPVEPTIAPASAPATEPVMTPEEIEKRLIERRAREGGGG